MRLMVGLPGFVAGAVLTAGLLVYPVAQAQTVEKINSFSYVVDPFSGSGSGGYYPLGAVTQAETNLWFLTYKGGTYDYGTVSRLNLVTREFSQVASLGNSTGLGDNSGANPNSSLVVVSNYGYFTTTTRGPGGKGTLEKISLDDGVVTTLYGFSSTNSLGYTPRGKVTRIGNELWLTTSLGGTSNKGTVLRYDLAAGTLNLVACLDGPVLGGYSYGGLVPGPDTNSWFFTTYLGGTNFGTDVTGSFPLGAGTLQKLSFDGQGNPVFTKLVDMPMGATAFPGSDPLLVGTNALYFTTVGPNAAPGALIRYDLQQGTWTNLFSFKTNADVAAAFGTRPGYNGLVQWQDNLYFLNNLAGASNAGAILKFSLSSRSLSKVVDLETNSLGYALNCRNNTPEIVQETNRYYAYLAISGGSTAATGLGTLLRLDLAPLPLLSALRSSPNSTLSLSWTGGYPPYDILTNSDLSAPLTNWSALVSGLDSTSTVTNWVQSVLAPQKNLFYRVRGQSQ